MAVYSIHDGIAKRLGALERRRRSIADCLRMSEIRFRRLFEAARDGVLIVDAASRRILDANPFITELLGCDRRELIGKELWEIGLLKDLEARERAFRELQEKGYIRYQDLPLESKRGDVREVEFLSNIYREGHADVIQCNIRDVTERKAEAELRRNKEQPALHLASFTQRREGCGRPCETSRQNPCRTAGSARPSMGRGQRDWHHSGEPSPGVSHV